MNAKNIISAILMVLSFAACSSDIEGLDDNMTNTSANTGETSISVRMVTEGISTKAGNEGTTIDPTTEEAAIKNYIIAVFETKSGERVGFATGTNTIPNIVCKEGEVTVYVVANASEKQFTNLYTLADFESVTVENLSDLVKVGKKEISLKQGEQNSLEIELLQLTARVKVNFKVSVQSVEQATVTFKAGECLAMIASSSDIHNVTAKDGELVKVDNSNSSIAYYTYAVNNPQLTLNGKLTVNGKNKDNTKDVKIDIPFKKDGQILSSLKDGVSYEITVEAILTVGVNAIPEISYQVHDIETIDQSISFE